MTLELAIAEDCRNFLQAFEDRARDNNIKFDHFCYVWKKIGFNYIYSVQKNDRDIVKTTKVAMLVAKSLIKNNSSLERKIGALYLLYALYYKQPTEKFLKIELTIDCWRALKGLVLLLDSCEYGNEPKYIFWKLKMDKAFRFVLSEYYYALEKFATPDIYPPSNELNRTNLPDILENDLHYLQNGETGYLPVVGKLEDKYNELKAQLNLGYENNDLNYVSLKPLNIMNVLKKSMSKVNDILTTKSDEDDEDGQSSIANKRSKIRKKAMFGHNQK